MDATFLLNQGLKIGVLLLLQLLLGLLVLHYNVLVNYTRKVIHFSLFFLPVYLDQVLAYDEDLLLMGLGTVGVWLTLVIYTRPVRERFPMVQIMFRSIDRPEDRPYTLLWLVTQVMGGFAVILPMAALLAVQNRLDLLLIPVLINGIGDGLAEPVGVRFGRHPYRVRALFTQRHYRRTLEGSACVFLTSIAVLLAFSGQFTPLQLAVALPTIPIIMTLAEAFSPHTWDTPFMFLAGYLSLWAVTLI